MYVVRRALRDVFQAHHLRIGVVGFVFLGITMSRMRLVPPALSHPAENVGNTASRAIGRYSNVYRFTMADGAEFIARNVTNSGQVSISLTRNGQSVFAKSYNGYLANVCRLRPSIEKELIIVSTVGASSQSYRLLGILDGHKPVVILDQVARPTGFSYIPEIKEGPHSLSIKLESTESRSIETFSWDRIKLKFERVRGV